jgi:hypothetical protein
MTLINSNIANQLGVFVYKPKRFFFGVIILFRSETPLKKLLQCKIMMFLAKYFD